MAMTSSLVALADEAARDIVIRLLDASLQGALVVACVWMVCAVCRSVPASMRAWLWWLASLKLVVALLALPSIQIPVLPSTPHDAARTASQHVVDTAALALPVETIKQLPIAVLPAEASAAARSLGWRIAVLLLAMGLFVAWWVVVLGLQLVALVVTHGRLVALVQRAQRADEHLQNDARALAARLRLRRVPEVWLSDEITSPQVTGFWRPRVLLPAAMSLFSEEERRMMLCHELTHVRRRDLVLGWIPALAERAFFFHPLARLAAREYVLAREAACDAAVVRVLDADPHRYARLLVRLGVSPSVPAVSAAGASSTTSILKRRLEMLYLTGPVSGFRRPWYLAIVAVLALVPLQLTARDAAVSRGADARYERLPIDGSEGGSLRSTHDDARRVADADAIDTESLSRLVEEVTPKVERFQALVHRTLNDPIQTLETTLERALADAAPQADGAATAKHAEKAALQAQQPERKAREKALEGAPGRLSVDALTASVRVAALEMELETARQTFTDKHPVVQNLLRELELARAARDRAKLEAARQMTPRVDPAQRARLAELTDRIERERIRLAEAEARMAAARARLAEAERRLEAAKAADPGAGAGR